MASSGSFNTSAYEGRYLTFEWNETSQNATNNTTTISWTLKGAGGGSVWYNAGNFKVSIAGEIVYSSATRIRLSIGTTVASGTYTFKHNADGTRSFTATAEAGIYTVAVNCNGSKTFALDTIARASQPSLITWPNHTQNVGYFGDTIAVHMNRQSSAFTHTVRYAFGNLSGTCINAETGKAATGVTTGFQWKIPLEFMDLLPAVTSGSGTIYVDTYNGSTKIGTKYCGFTASVPASVKPTCSIQVLDNTNVKDIYGSLVKGLSKLYVKTTGTAAYSSPINAYNVTANGVRYTAAEIVTGVLTAAGTTKVTATVTDRRGRTSAAASASFTVLDYSQPAVTKLAAIRCNQDGTANKRGAYIKVTFSATVTSLSSKNTAQYRLKYKKTADTTYTTVTISALANKYTVTNHTYIFAAAANAYDIIIEAVDRHYTASKSTKAPTTATIFSWRGFKTANGTEDGVGIGRVPDKANTLEIGWDVEFFGKVKGTIFDAVYPVGSVYIAYNHTNPGTLFGGTWTRIQNAFLWATTSGGTIGQTGGEQTVTLTTEQIPAHSHGSVYSQHAEGTKSQAWYTTAGTSLAYGVVETGGGEAHNNMPPYIQVSIWRRTA